MKVRYLDKSLKDFISISSVFIGILLFTFFGMLLIYRYSTLDTYNFILYILAFLFFVAAGYTTLVVLFILRIYKNKISGKTMGNLIKWNMNLLFPMVISLSGILGKEKDFVRGFLIEINNILVESGISKYNPEDILVLLPHCLQNSECLIKVTNDISNCKRCGKCCINDLCELSKHTGVDFRVVTGGTVARSLVKKRKPKVILSVACERDLTSGISDIRKIPVLGILNDRKNGPCFNTSVDMGCLKVKLNKLLKLS